MRHILFIYFMFSVISAFSQNTQISPGVLWNDLNGEQINAHGGCVVFEKWILLLVWRRSYRLCF